MVVNNCRSFEECLNHFFKSCIPNSQVTLTSFAHNENKGEQVLKYDLHIYSVEALQGFYKAFTEGLSKISSASNGAISYEDVNTPGLDCAYSLLNVDSIFPGYTAFIRCGNLSIGFDLYSISEYEVVFFLEMPKFCPKDEREFVSAYSKAFNWKTSVSEQTDKSIYKNKKWCWGERYTISNYGISYTGDTQSM